MSEKGTEIRRLGWQCFLAMQTEEDLPAIVAESDPIEVLLGLWAVADTTIHELAQVSGRSCFDVIIDLSL